MSGILRAATSARWPMYLRNVKQILRAGELRRTKLRLRRLDGSAARLPARRTHEGRARSPQRPESVPGERARTGGSPAFIIRPGVHRAGRISDRPRRRSRTRLNCRMMATTSATWATLSRAVTSATSLSSQPTSVVDTTAELLGRAKPKRGARAAALGTSPNHEEGGRSAACAPDQPRAEDERRIVRPESRNGPSATDGRWLERSGFHRQHPPLDVVDLRVRSRW